MLNSLKVHHDLALCPVFASHPPIFPILLCSGHTGHLAVLWTCWALDCLRDLAFPKKKVPLTSQSQVKEFFPGLHHQATIIKHCLLLPWELKGLMVGDRQTAVRGWLLELLMCQSCLSFINDTSSIPVCCAEAEMPAVRVPSPEGRVQITIRTGICWDFVLRALLT